MKRFFKSSLSLILAITIIFSSAVVGLSEIDFDKTAIDSKLNDSEFDINSVYELFSELDLSSNLAVKAEAADYSDLTPNEYMTRVLLNYKYSGYLNDYGASDITYQNELLNYYYNLDEISSARLYYEDLMNDNDFKSTLGMYKMLSFDLGDAATQAMELEDYYTAILLNIIDAKFQDDNFIDSLNCELNKNVAELSKTVFDILDEFEKPGTVLVSSLSTTQVQSISNAVAGSANHDSLYKLTGKNISIISDFLLWSNSVNEGIKKICAYTSIANTSVALENVLHELYLNCPSSNEALKRATYKVYKYVGEEIGYTALALMTAGEEALEAGIKTALSAVWEMSIEAFYGAYPVLGLKLAQIVGKGIGNFCCGTDKILEQLVVIGCLLDFEDIMVSTVKSIENDYKNSWTENNADNFIKAVELLLATYDLDCQYSSDYLKLVYNGGVVTSVITNFKYENSLQMHLNAFQQKRANIRWELVRFPDYAMFFEKDAPSGYNVYFGSGGQNNNGDDDSFVPQYITLNNRSLELAVNMSATLTATISPVNPNHRDTISYWSSDDSIVSVDVTEGIITALAPGSVTITAVGTTVSGQIRTTCNVTVLPFSVSQNDTGYTIKKYLGSATNVSIPSEINGVDVTGIGFDAFYRRDKLISITIPDSIKTIENEAFHNCWNLTTVNMGNGVKTIGDKAFFDCDDLVSITIPDSVTNIGQSAFSFCESLKSLTIGKNVTSIGEDAFYNCKIIESLYIGNQYVMNYLLGSNSTCSFGCLSTVVLGDGVTSVIDNAFNSFKTLTSIIISNSVTSIGNSAFGGCGSLISITIPDGVTSIGDGAFLQCTKLTSITIPDSVTHIGKSAFRMCDNLSSITIPDSVISMGDSVFESCDSLMTVDIGNGVTSIGDEAFAFCENLESITIGNSVKSIGIEAFYECVKLETLELPDSLKSIGKSAFMECRNLVSINVSDRNTEFTSDNGVLFNKNKTTLVYYPANINAQTYVIPETVTTIYAGAFASNNFLEIITIPENVETIDDYAFVFCQKLKSVTIGNGVRHIGVRAFYYCLSLTSIIIPNSVTSIGDYAFFCCFSLATLKISNSVTSLGEMVFGCCETLTSVTIPETITSIGGGAFAYCTNLKTINIPNNVTTIGAEAFARCTSLTSITIPDGVTCIEYSAFSGCASLSSIAIPDSVTSIEHGAFDKCTALEYVFYSGSESDWINISIDNTKNELLTTATIHYNATDHSYKEIIDVEVSCTNNGLKHRVCNVCGLCSDSEIITSTGHKYSTEWTIDKVATCTENGLRSKTCLVCGSVITEEIEKIRHSYSHEWTIDIKSTCTTSGSKSHHCTVCDDKTDITVITAIGHTYEWEENTDDLTKIGTCSVCGDVIVETMTSVDVATFTLNGTGTGYTVADCSCDYSGEVEIPEIYNGLPVTAIDADAFRDCTGITSVVIPDSVTSIGGSAFRGCTNLKEIDFSDNITSIPGAMCYGCSNLKSIIIPEGVVNIGGYAFSGCTSLKNVVIPDSVTNIGSSVFVNCNSLIVLSNENSTGHTYAKNNNISFIANNDNTMVDLSKNVIKTNYLNSDISDIMASSQGLTYSISSNVSGSGVLVDVMKDSALHSQFTLVVNGDTDGDSICDVLDCAQVELASNSNTNLSGAYAMAADSNSDDVVDITDYQAIVNKALAS